MMKVKLSIFMTAIVLMVIVAGSTYSCTQFNTKYYAAMQNCVDRGGTWIPTHDYDAICLELAKH